MIGILLVTHGDFGTELIKSAELIIGHQTNVKSLCLHQGDDVERLKAEVRKAIMDMDEGEGVMVLTDLFGGSPANVCAANMKDLNFSSLTGVNLPMLLEAMCSRKNNDLASTMKLSYQAGIDGIVDMKKLLVYEEEARNQLREIQDKISKDMGEDKAAIFSAHLLMLDDSVLQQKVEDNIKLSRMNAAAALSKAIDEVCEVFETLDDEYMKERAQDIRDIGNRLLYNIAGIKADPELSFDKEVIIVAKELTPSDTARFDYSKVIGFVTDLGEGLRTR
ncbi:MAG: Phosphoenolpyruvate-protein phosphotransferase of PTS system [Firmicutes bacterium]|nr:Phosphoenolpyruvate-protein phosphotransferase of PTS system [Bacillota bacterium]MDI6706573.1 phosphoenolpyruvate-utilizing N-terminal domain-containing protein [Bacillota bacterium]